MGKEWYNWGGGRSLRRGDNNRESPGCMSGVLNLFDFQQFQFSSITHQPCFKPNSSILQDDTTIIKGTEAPRNSLESEKGGGVLIGTSSLSKELKEEDSYIPVEILRLHTKVPELSSSSSEICSSPGTKTPNLVARLMGLEILPDSLSPSSSKTHHEHYSREQNGVQFGRQIHRKTNRLVENEDRFEMAGSRSLPETPRISSARRSDVESRLSLQINKENIMVSEEFDYLRRVVSSEQKLRKKDWKFDQENRSPSHYSRQIVKQVKEKLGRKMGVDITNITTSRRLKPIEGDALTLKSKKPKRLTEIGEESPTCSPRFRFMETKSKPVSTSLDQIFYSRKPESKPRAPSPPPPPPTTTTKELKDSSKPKSQPLQQHQTIKKCRKASCERFTPSKANPKISDKKCKKTPLSNDVPSFQTQKLTRPAQASKSNSRLSSCSSRAPYKEPLNDRDDNKNRNISVTDQFRWYVTDILKCTGIYRNTHVSFSRWFSPSHPLDPSIFNLLEHSSIPITTITGFLKHRWNRKLIFNLVDEILVEKYMKMKPWVLSLETKISDFEKKRTRGDQLLQELCSEIQSFPSANCVVLQDIDALIEKDLTDANVRKLPMLDETESIVFEIERDILDSLVHETAVGFHLRLTSYYCKIP